MSALEFLSTSPIGRRLANKGAIGRKTEIRSYKLEPDSWDDRRDRSVVMGHFSGGKEGPEPPSGIRRRRRPSRVSTSAHELQRSYAQADAIALEEWIERRQLDRQLERLGFVVKPTPRPRFRSRLKAKRTTVPSKPEVELGRQAIVRRNVGRVLGVR